jgi:hypothetical protein
MTDQTTTSAADRLESGIQGISVPEPSADTEALLLKFGIGLPILGVIMIVLAYWQASGSKYVADQIPMLISGGLLGLALIMVGLGLFLRFSLARMNRFWLARMVVEQQASADRIVEALTQVETAIRDVTTDQPVIVQVPDKATH